MFELVATIRMRLSHALSVRVEHLDLTFGAEHLTVTTTGNGRRSLLLDDLSFPGAAAPPLGGVIG